ncbi:MAG: sulfotransferase [Phycisphaerae bacterium]|jgi:hypothetical protein|nr:sulfotransferase [Phycisphaerae bacterium]
MTLPSFLGIGAAKAGTSWLHAQLKHHPETYVPSRRKEIHYFDRYYGKGLDWYAGFFPDAVDTTRYRAIGEITPRYFVDPDAPGRIARTLSHPRLIVILRNPIDRFDSHYRMIHTTGRTKASPLDFRREHPDAFDMGLYARQLKRYREHFAPEQLLILIYEEIFADNTATHQALDRIAELLDIDASRFSSATADQRVGADLSSGRPRFARAYAQAYRLRRWLMDKDLEAVVGLAERCGISKASFGRSRPPPRLSESDREALGRAYAADVRELRTLLGRPLEAWTDF